MPLLGEEPFLVVNGDIATDFPFGALTQMPIDLAHLVLVPNPVHHPKGDFGLNEGKALDGGNPRFTFGGIGVYSRELFRNCSPGSFPLAPLLRAAMARAAVSAQLYEGLWMDIGTVERLRDLMIICAPGGKVAGWLACRTRYEHWRFARQRSALSLNREFYCRDGVNDDKDGGSAGSRRGRAVPRRPPARGGEAG